MVESPCFSCATQKVLLKNNMAKELLACKCDLYLIWKGQK
jgi:hypothetical protein